MNIQKKIKLIGALFVLILIIISLYFVLRVPAHSQWVLVNGNGSKCLDVGGASLTNGVGIFAYGCHGGTFQQFDITLDGGGIIKMGDLCLDSANGKHANGTELILWKCHGGVNQKWIYDKTKNRLINYFNKCVDLKKDKANWQLPKRAILWDCNNTPTQKWYLSALVLASKLDGGKLIDSNIQKEIKPSQKIYATSNGVLHDQNDQPNLPSKKSSIKVESEATVINLKNEHLLLPVVKLK